MVIIGGNILTAAGPAPADIHLAGEKIAAVVPRAPKADLARDPDTFDAGGRWVLPGAVDAHTHFGMPLAGGITSLGWRESSTAALLGGTTTVIDFANPQPGEPLGAAVARWRQAADGACRCDYGLHVTVPETPSERLGELPALVAAGLPTFKGFLAYKGRLMLDPAQMGRLMAAVAGAGGMLLVHAEDGELNAAAEQILVGTGRTAPCWHPQAHPAASELQAVDWALDLALERDCPLTIVHMSLAGSLELLEQARRRRDERGLATPLWGEVCLHHLLADESLYSRGHESALAALCSPPLRTADDGRALLAGLARGELDLLSTDHCEFALAVKTAAAARGFSAVPNGCGGVGERLVHSYTRAVLAGDMSPQRWVQVLCERPAEVMGLGGRKGRLLPGHDADIVVFDPEPAYRWEPLGPSDRPGSLYAGLPVRGRVTDVWLRGRRVVKDGRLCPDRPGGAFLPRSLAPGA